MHFEPTLEFARAQDESDPLRSYRERFHFVKLLANVSPNRANSFSVVSARMFVSCG